MKNHADLSPAAEQPRQRPGGHLASFNVVGSHEARVVLAIEARVKNRYRNSGSHDAIDSLHQSIPVRRSQRQSINTAGDH